MSQANPLWGTPRIHGELLKLGIAVAQSTAAIDFFTVPTATFRVLFVFVVLSHERRRVVHFGVTEHPTEEWTMQQMREAFPWDQAPRYVLRDRDAIYGKDFAAMTRSLCMEEVLTAPRSLLAKDAPEPRAVKPQAQGRVVSIPQVGGLHHRCLRRAA
jgi:putative transposase